MYLLMKPASGACNLRCAYCFYADEMNSREDAVRPFMTAECFRAAVSAAYSRLSSPGSPDRSLSIGFQGGEPTLAGLGFFRDAVSFAESARPDGITLNWFIQTNGVKIDAEWAAFLAEKKFLCGLSFDGYPELHDKNRKKPGGAGTSSDVLRAARILEAAGAEFNILTVLTGEAARSPQKIYSFCRKNRFVWQQYIPCVAPLGGEDTPWTLGAERYGSFLCRLFDLWYDDLAAGRGVYNREFENWVGIIAGIEPEDCGMRGVCSPQYLIESDGSVYPCDFYALDEYRIGNITEDGFDEIDEKRAVSGFIAESERLSEKCFGCEWRFLCRGGCRRNRDADGLNRFCEGYKKFFAYSYERMKRIADSVRANGFGK